jgi:serine/threonine protein kinase
LSSLVGQLIGPYRVLSQLGRGGMGEVYRAEHTLLGREVALKTIRPEMAERRSVLERFFNEARAVNAIGHPNIVDIHDVGRTPEGMPYCVMELLRGQSLHQLRKRLKVLEPPLAVHLAAQIADALAASHRAGIVHRDLKPQNVFVVERPENPHFVKVLDFGIAKLVGSASATSTGAVTGPTSTAWARCSTSSAPGGGPSPPRRQRR